MITKQSIFCWAKTKKTLCFQLRKLFLVDQSKSFLFIFTRFFNIFSLFSPRCFLVKYLFIGGQLAETFLLAGFQWDHCSVNHDLRCYIIFLRWNLQVIVFFRAISIFQGRKLFNPVSIRIRLDKAVNFNILLIKYEVLKYSHVIFKRNMFVVTHLYLLWFYEFSHVQCYSVFLHVGCIFWWTDIFENPASVILWKAFWWFEYPLVHPLLEIKNNYLGLKIV